MPGSKQPADVLSAIRDLQRRLAIQERKFRQANNYQWNRVLGFDPTNNPGGITFAVANSTAYLRVIPWKLSPITKFLWATGGTVAGNYDIGIYNDAGQALWTKGLTAWPAANTLRTEPVSPTVTLNIGSIYWLALAADTNTATFRGISTALTGLPNDLDGLPYSTVDAAQGPPLPATVTLPTVSGGRIAMLNVRIA